MDALISWVTTHLLGLIVGLVLLVIVYRSAKPFIHKLVLTVLNAQQQTLDGGGAPAEEVRKRAKTLEDLLNKVIRFAVFLVVIFLLLTVFDLWPLLAGLGLIAAALTIAGQQIILDYLMGILILVEAQYFNGDWISVDNGNAIVEGEVEEVGLRRTTIRDTAGVVHSISNGLIRVSSNWTRVYAIASVQVHVLRGQDLDRSLAIVDKVGREMLNDPAWKDVLLEAPKMTSISDMTVDGAMLWVRCRTQPEARWTAATEIRKRLAAALAADGVSTARWDPSALAALTQGQAGLTSEGSV